MFYYMPNRDFDVFRRGEILGSETELTVHVLNGDVRQVDTPKDGAKIRLVRGQAKAPSFSGEAVHRLGYHPVTTSEQADRYNENRRRFMELFDYIQSVGNPSREQSLALTALQESLMWLNAHVACHNVDGE